MWFILRIFCIFTVPIPTMNVIALSPPTVGHSLVLRCSVTLVRGITDRVDIIWRSDSVILTRTYNTLPSVGDTSLVYSDHYGIPSVLTSSDDGREYQCEVMINTSPPVMSTGSVILDVMGECK